MVTAVVVRMMALVVGFWESILNEEKADIRRSGLGAD
jgi:hypothetical protein